MIIKLKMLNKNQKIKPTFRKKTKVRESNSSNNSRINNKINKNQLKISFYLIYKIEIETQL